MIIVNIANEKIHFRKNFENIYFDMINKIHDHIKDVFYVLPTFCKYIFRSSKNVINSNDPDLSSEYS